MEGMPVLAPIEFFERACNLFLLRALYQSQFIIMRVPFVLIILIRTVQYKNLYWSSVGNSGWSTLD